MPMALKAEEEARLDRVRAWWGKGAGVRGKDEGRGLGRHVG
jgi:hypothetical protein